MPDINAQFLSETDTFSDMIIDNTDAVNYLYRCIAMIACGEVKLCDTRQFARETLKGVDLIKPAPQPRG